MDREQQLGILGLGLMAVGVFLPLVFIPLVGTINYFFEGQGDGVGILVIVVIGFFALVMKSYRPFAFMGVMAAGLCTFTLSRFLGVIGDDPFARALIQLEWGWIVLYAGAFLTIYAGYMGYKNSRYIPEGNDNRKGFNLGSFKPPSADYDQRGRSDNYIDRF